MGQSIRFLTVASDPSPHLDRLLDSAKRQGIELEILGLGKPYPGFGYKLVLVRDALRMMNPDDLFLFVDAYDVIFTGPEAEILEKFKSLNVKVLFNAEQNFMTKSPHKWRFFWQNPIKKKPYRYLNSGVYVAYAGAFLDILDEISFTETSPCDQTLISTYFFENPGRIALDVNNLILSCSGGRSGCMDTDYTVKSGRLWNNVTETFPCVLHVPGKAYPYLDKLSRQLGVIFPEITYSDAHLKALGKKSVYQRRVALSFRDNYVYLFWEKVLIYTLLLGLLGGIGCWVFR